ncbi:hypothetical protein [Paenibacillus sp. YYML68]|uniref:hypothetical protein n=1 Tax=Paenibacillus sp. YYML68 TaxID=2909250 RepID=UPI00248FB77A|nr:hypothetical protein [Paenibacillus sp. YYML68]
MNYRATTVFTIIGAALCVLHFFGHEYDPIYLLFYAFSVPAWFYPFFSYTNINPFWLYTLTIVSWTIIGYLIDRFTVIRQKRRSPNG